MRGVVASTWEPAQRSRVDPAQGWPRRAGPPARGLHVPRQGTLKVSSRSGRSVSTNQIDPPGRGGWPTSGKPAAVTPHGCGIFKNGGQCVGARRTPRYPLERGHLAGRGPLEPLGEFRPRPLISRPWKGVASPSLSQNDVIVSNPGSAAARGMLDREENSR